jgi:uncharacterized protein (TIGR02453 family)
MQIQSILDFLTELKENNNREWFSENKSRYEILKSEFEVFSKDLIAAISVFDEEIKHVEAKDCIFRIYRDTRFSHDKTPYKTHFGVYIASGGGRKSQRGGYYIHLDPSESFVGCGVWCPQPDVLKALRQSVCDNIDELNAIRQEPEFSKYFNEFFQEDKLKTVPKGFPKDFVEPELLKLKHYLVSSVLTDQIIKSENCVSEIANILQCAYPFNKFLNYTVDEVL